ncbi:MAG: isochorismatase family protein [Candidatus Paceibacterota bacterium]|jgi:nicotinamidase-related amidase
MRQKTETGLTAVLVDMQKGFIRENSHARLRKIISAQIDVIRGVCVSHDIPLIVLEYRGQGRTLEELEVEISCVKRVVRLIKRVNDGFYDGKLEEVLHRFRTGRLLLMGINASFCVMETAGTAIELGYEIVTAHTLTTNTTSCSASKESDISNALGWYERNGQVFKGTPTFEEIAQI